MQNKLELVVFDLAGTTVKHNKEVHFSFMNAFEEEGIAISYDDANNAMGKPKPVAIHEILTVHNRVSDPLIDKIHASFQDKIVSYYRESEEVEEKPGTSELFEFLKSKGVLVSIDTGFDRFTADVLIEKLKWKKNGLVDYSVTSDEVQKGRPEPDMIFKLMGLSNVNDSSKVMKVGDTPVDLLEGDNANVKYNIGVTTGAFTAEELQKYPHSHLISNLLKIKSLPGLFD